MATTEARGMAKTRALLTATEREQLAGEHGDNRKYQATSRVRRRMRDELPRDVEVFENYQQDLLAQLRETVCVGSDAGIDEDTAREAVHDAREAYESEDDVGVDDALTRLENILEADTE